MGHLCHQITPHSRPAGRRLTHAKCMNEDKGAGGCLLVHLLADLLLCHALELRVEPEMLLHCQPVKEHIVLGTHAQVLPDLVHFRTDIMAIDGSRARCWREQASEDGPGWMEKGNSVRELILLSLAPVPTTTSGSICWAPGREVSTKGHEPTACLMFVPAPHPHCCPLSMALAATAETS